MPTLPHLSTSLVVRTYFGDADAWSSIRAELATPTIEGFVAYVDLVDDPAFDGFDITALKAAHPENDEVSVLFVADEITCSFADHPVLVVDVVEFEGEVLEPFRCVSTELWSVENNLNIANLDWSDFVDAADEDGVYRGFPG